MLINPQSSPQSVAGDGLRAKHRIVFLNSVFLMAAIVAFGMGFYRWQQSRLMGAIDVGFSLISLAALVYLKRRPHRVESVSTMAIMLAFVLFLAIYILAAYNTMRLSLFFLLSAAVFFLKGRRTGLRWLCFILVTIVVVHLVPAFKTGYSNIDIVTTCIYLVALYFIFWNYETVREEQHKALTEQELQSRIDERWRLALEGVGDAIWDWNLKSGHFACSSNYAEMLGYSAAEIGQSEDHLERLLHPQDKAGARALLTAYLAGEGTEQYVAEARLRCKDGSYKWILCRGRVMQRSSRGRPRRMVGTHVDITERKLAQEEIVKASQALRDERSLLQTILDNAPLGIWMVNAEGKVQFVNQGFCSNTGVSEAQFLAASHYSDVLPASIAENCRRSDRECFGQEAPHVSLECLRFVDGRDHLLECTKVRVRNSDGSNRGLIGLAVDVTERHEHEQQLEHVAHYDALTGVPNRVLLTDRLAQALARTKRDRGLMAVCYLDLDGFKPINDTYGHDAGDKVLVEVARRIKDTIREGDTIVRLGGDEFVVLLVGMQLSAECVGSLNRLLKAISQPITVAGQPLSISASVGVALYPEDDQDADTLLRHADQAMYVAKHKGRNCYHLFDARVDK